MISFQVKGDWKKTVGFLQRVRKIDLTKLMKYGEEGVQALKNATPVDSGLTRDSWYYKLVEDQTGIRIEYCNSNLSKDWFPVAIMLQYGHYTGTGGWVEGRDYINPAIQPIFDKIAKHAWEEVTAV